MIRTFYSCWQSVLHDGKLTATPEPCIMSRSAFARYIRVKSVTCLKHSTSIDGRRPIEAESREDARKIAIGRMIG